MQLPLHFLFSAGRRFENFETPPENLELVDAVRRITIEQTPARVLVVGKPGTGKSHLLAAACAAASANGGATAFIPMRDWRSQPVEAVHGLGRYRFVCIDDVDAIAGDRAWEEALLALVEESTPRSTRLLVSVSAMPSRTRFAFADLRSRLNAATLYRLRELNDESKRRALRRYASKRGIELSDDVIGYVLARHRRDLPSLIALIDQLDYHSLAHRRRLTVPFVRNLIGTAD